MPRYTLPIMNVILYDTYCTVYYIFSDFTVVGVNHSANWSTNWSISNFNPTLRTFDVVGLQNPGTIITQFILEGSENKYPYELSGKDSY